MALILKAEVVGLEKVKSALNRLGTDALRALSQSLVLEGEGLMREAKLETPVDKGPLRASGFVTIEPASAADKVAVVVGFGGAATPYALEQHENLSYNHTVGKAKYLEDPFNRRLQGLEERIGKSLRAQLPIIR